MTALQLARVRRRLQPAERDHEQGQGEHRDDCEQDEVRQEGLPRDGPGAAPGGAVAGSRSLRRQPTALASELMMNWLRLTSSRSAAWASSECRDVGMRMSRRPLCVAVGARLRLVVRLGRAFAVRSRMRLGPGGPPHRPCRPPRCSPAARRPARSTDPRERPRRARCGTPGQGLPAGSAMRARALPVEVLGATGAILWSAPAAGNPRAPACSELSRPARSLASASCASRDTWRREIPSRWAISFGSSPARIGGAAPAAPARRVPGTPRRGTAGPRPRRAIARPRRRALLRRPTARGSARRARARAPTRRPARRRPARPRSPRSSADVRGCGGARPASAPRACADPARVAGGARCRRGRAGTCRISPAMFGTANAASSSPRSTSKRSIALISPMQPTWYRSSYSSEERV